MGFTRFSSYGWVEDGECLFDVDIFKVKNEGHGNEFIDHSALKRRLQNTAKEGEPVGLIFLPKGVSVSVEEAAVAAIVIGRNKLAPSIKHLCIIAPPEGKLKVDLRRKALAYSPKNIVLVDQAYGRGALLSEDVFFFANGKWQIADKYLEVPDTPYSRAASARVAFHAEESFVTAASGNCEQSWSFIYKELSETSAAIDEKISRFVNKRNKQSADARRNYRVLSANKLPEPVLRDITEFDVNLALAGQVETNGFCKWYNGWSQASSGKSKGWHNVDDLTDKDAGLKNRIREMYLLPETAKYIRGLERDRERISYVRKIWETMLKMNESPLRLPSVLSRPNATDAHNKLTDKVLAFTAETYGIDAAIETWADGVPLADVFA